MEIGVHGLLNRNPPTWVKMLEYVPNVTKVVVVASGDTSTQLAAFTGLVKRMLSGNTAQLLTHLQLLQEIINRQIQHHSFK